MSTALIGADNLRNFISKIKPLIELADYLEEIGKLEQVAAEAQRASEAAQAQLVESRNALVNAQADVTEAKEIAARIVAEAEAAAALTKSQAETNAGVLLAEAKAKCDEMIAEAQRRVDELNADRALGGEQLARLIAEVDVKEAELNKINSGIEELRSKLGA